jgi:hypothetical protein
VSAARAPTIVGEPRASRARKGPRRPLAGAACATAALALAAVAAASSCTFQIAGLDIDASAGPIDLGADLATRACDPAGADDQCSADGGAVLTCRADGSGFDSTPCAVACGQAPTPHCAHLVPSVPGAATTDFTQPGLAQVTLGGDTLVDTDNGSITGGVTRAPGGGVNAGIGYREFTQPAASPSWPKIAIFSFGGLTVPPGVRVTFTGAHAVMIVSSQAVSLGGVLDLAAGCVVGAPGPGGFGGGSTFSSGRGDGPAGGLAGLAGGSGTGGGGGGGFGDVGGPGGGGSGGTGGAGGAIVDLASLNVFVGGSGGGVGASNLTLGRGGAGGGALAVLVDGMLSVGGTINVSACGGGGGDLGGGGGGGGAGGVIDLEAARVALAAASVLAANGGGGGAGNSPASPGATGGAGAGAAPGGVAGPGGRGGGDGGAHTPSTNGKAGGSTTAEKICGGGGGATGRIFVRVRAGTGNVMDQGAVWSPDPADVDTTGGRPAQITTATFN